jgi:hypothetical protein
MDAAAAVSLNRLYTLYDEVVGDLPLACRRGCSVCCTADVTLTSLEGSVLLGSLGSAERERLLRRLGPDAGGRRPRLTINAFAARCMEDGDPPDEDDPDPGKPCPLLLNHECPVYTSRPFACRCMVSESVCTRTEPAEVPPFVLTVNTVFMQVIENLDCRGFSGNLSHMLPALSRGLAVQGQDPSDGLIPNRRSGVLMVPPEHRDRLRPILEAMARACRTQG